MAVIYDRTGMTDKNRDYNLIKFFKQFVQIMQDYYFERLAMFYVINANWVYKMMYAATKLFLATKTRNKVLC